MPATPIGHQYDMASGNVDWAKPPLSPSDLGNDWRNVTHPDNNSGSQDFENKNTGERIRFDPGKKGESGWEGIDHWHRYNPSWEKTMGKRGYYLDRFGNEVLKGSDPSHIGAGDNINVGAPVYKGIPGGAWDQYYKESGDYPNKVEKYNDEMKDYNEQMENYRNDLKEYNDAFKAAGGC